MMKEQQAKPRLRRYSYGPFATAAAFLRGGFRRTIVASAAALIVSAAGFGVGATAKDLGPKRPAVGPLQLEGYQPAQVGGLQPLPRYSDYAGLTLGGAHTCMLATKLRPPAGSRYLPRVALCWGDNAYGQLGNGTNVNFNTPVEVALPGEPSSISAGTRHTCAALATGLWCWGDNNFGQLGDGTANPSTLPVQVQGLPAIALTQYALGEHHTCALLAGGEVWCWGDGRSGQLGSGAFHKQPAPPTIVSVKGFTRIAAGGSTTCGTILEAYSFFFPQNVVWCWGRNGSGQLGNGNTTDQAAPTRNGFGVFVGTRVLTVGGAHACVSEYGGGGLVSCWGSNGRGQIGDGTVQDRWSPTTVRYPAQDVPSAGGEHTCSKAFSADPVVCWGKNESGQLGNGTFSKRSTVPVPVLTAPGLPSMPSFGVRAVTGGSHSCAYEGYNFIQLWCWGANDKGQVGDGTFTDRSFATPIFIP